jgi:hypothetical protein
MNNNVKSIRATRKQKVRYIPDFELPQEVEKKPMQLDDVAGLGHKILSCTTQPFFAQNMLNKTWNYHLEIKKKKDEVNKHQNDWILNL